MEAALRDVVRHLKSHPASPTSAILEDCAHMLDHGLHSLRKALPQLSSRIRLRHQPKGKLRRVRGLLSAAMTNQDSCLGGFGEDLGQGEAHKLRRQSRDLEKQLREGLGPILRLLSKSLTILKEIETKNSKTSRRPHLVGPRTRITRRRSGSSRSRHSHMRSLIGLARPLPDAIVDGMSTVTSPNITTLSPHTFRTISEAVEAAPANSRRRHVIWIRAGTYHENVVIPSNKTHLLLVGEGMDKTVISGNRSVSVARCTTYASATLAVSGDSFAARDLTVENTAGPMAGQAVALRVSADCAAFYRCGILGHQDTLYAHSLSQFYRDCVVRGTVDFIFGNAAAVFQGCRVEALKPVLGQWNMVTAQGRADPGEPTGFALHNCTVVAAGADGEGSRRDGDTYLGRPWRSHARTMVMGSYLGGVVHPEGWHEWTEPRALAGVRLMEYRNSGPGADTSRRVKWARVNVTAEEAREFAIGELIGGRWLNSTAYPFRYGI